MSERVSLPVAANGILGLRMFLWGMTVHVVIAVALRLTLHVLLTLDPAGEMWGEWTLGDVFGLLTGSAAVVHLLCLGVMAAGLWSYLATARRGGAAALALPAAALVCLALLWGVVAFFISHVGDGDLGTMFRWGAVSKWIAEAVVVVLVVLAAARVSRSLEWNLGAGVVAVLVFAALDALLALLPALGVPLRELLGSTWLWQGLLYTVYTGLLVSLWLVLGTHIGHLAATPAPPEPEAGLGRWERFAVPPWPAVRNGLAAYRAALLTKIVVVLGGFGLMVLANLAESRGGVKVTLIGSSLLGLAATLGMAAGLAGYARVPAESGARGPALATLVAMGVGVLLELYTLVLVFQMFSGNYSAARNAIDRAPFVEGAAMGIGVVGMIGLLVSFRRAGDFIDAPEVGARVAPLFGLLVGVAAGGLTLRFLVAQRTIGGYLALPLAIAILVLAIVALTMFLRTLRDLRGALGAFDYRSP